MKDDHIDKKTGLLSKLLGVGVLRVVAIPVGLLTSIVLARNLGADGFGQYSFLMTLLALLAVPIAGGIRPLLTREVAISRYERDLDRFKAVVRAALAWVICASALFCGIGFLLIHFSLVPDSGKWSYLWIVVLMLPLMGIGAVRDGLLKGMKEPFWAVFLSFVLHPVLLLGIVMLVFWVGELNVVSGLFSQMASIVLVLLLSLWVLVSKAKFSGGKKVQLYSLSRWGGMILPFFAVNLVMVMCTHMGILLLGFMGSDEDVAAFRVAERGAYLVGMSLVLINMVIPPYMVEAWKNKDRERVKKLLWQSATNGFLISLPVALILVVFGKSVVGIVFGEEFKEISYYPLVILSLGQLVNVLFGAAVVLLTMTGFERDVIRAQIPGLLINAGIAMSLIPFWGASGAALGAVIGQFTINVIVAYFVIKRVNIRPAFL